MCDILLSVLYETLISFYIFDFEKINFNRREDRFDLLNHKNPLKMYRSEFITFNV